MIQKRRNDSTMISIDYNAIDYNKLYKLYNCIPATLKSSDIKEYIKDTIKDILFHFDFLMDYKKMYSF